MRDEPINLEPGETPKKVFRLLPRKPMGEDPKAFLRRLSQAEQARQAAVQQQAPAPPLER